MRRLFTLVLALALALPCLAGGASGRFRSGIEWGANFSFWQFYHFNYISDAGARVDSQDSHFTNYINGTLRAHAGVLLSPAWELDLVSGYVGLWDDRAVVPVNLRLAFYRGGCDLDGGLRLFLEGGPLIGRAKGDAVSWLVREGAGRRIMLSDRLSMDLILSLQQSIDHPGGSVFDPGHGIYIPEGNALRSNTSYCALCFSVALNL